MIVTRNLVLRVSPAYYMALKRALDPCNTAILANPYKMVGEPDEMRHLIFDNLQAEVSLLEKLQAMAATNRAKREFFYSVTVVCDLEVNNHG